MKRILLTILLSGIWFLSTAQTTSTLPSGYTPFATQLYYKIAGGDTTIISGVTGKGFHVLQTTQALRDSLDLYYTKIESDARYVPLARTLSINGTSQDLSVNRTWTVTANTTNSLTNGYGINTFSFNGNSAQIVSLDTSIVDTKYVRNSTSLQTPANFNISATGQMRRLNVDYIYSKSSTRNIVFRDTTQFDRPAVFFDSTKVFSRLGSLFKTQAIKVNGAIELYSDAVGKLGRDIDFIKTRNGGAPSIGDEYGYINFRTKDSTGNALPAIQMIGRVSTYAGSNYALGDLEIWMRNNSSYPGTKLFRLTPQNIGYLNGTWRVQDTTQTGLLRVNGLGINPSGFTTQKAGINGNLWMYGSSSPRTLDFIQEKAAGFDIGDNYGGIDTYGITTAGGTQRASLINTFVGENKTLSIHTGKIKMAVRTAANILDTALVIKDDADVNIKHDLIVNEVLRFDNNTDYILWGSNASVNPYMQGGSDNSLYIGTGNGPALQITPGKNIKISQLTGSVTDMVTISTDGTLGRTAIPSGGGGGSVVTVGVASANGFGGSSSGGANPALTITSTLNTPILASNGTALIAATTTGSGTTAVLSTSPTLTASSNYLNLTATGTSGYTEYKSSTSTLRGYIGNGSSILLGAAVSDFIVRSEGDLVLASGNNHSARVTTSGLGIPYGKSFYFNSSNDQYINANDSTIFIGVDNSVVATAKAGSFVINGNISGSNLSGTNTGDQTNITGNAGTATALQTARTIAGVSFNGTANISLNNNSITNGAGYITASSTNTLTNKSGNISQWTNDSGYGTGTVTSIASGSGMGFSTITGTGTITMGTPSSITSSSTNSTSTTSHTHAITSLPSATTATTQTAGDNSTKVATTAYVYTAATRQLEEFYSDVQNSGSTITDLYTFTVPANTLVNDGDKIAFYFAGIYAGNTNTKSLSIEFGSGFAPVISTLFGSHWQIHGYLIKVSATTYRISISKEDGSTSDVINGVGTVTNFTSSNIFKLRGDGDATADITAKSGYLEFKPAAL